MRGGRRRVLGDGEGWECVVEEGGDLYSLSFTPHTPLYGVRGKGEGVSRGGVGVCGVKVLFLIITSCYFFRGRVCVVREGRGGECVVVRGECVWVEEGEPHYSSSLHPFFFYFFRRKEGGKCKEEGGEERGCSISKYKNKRSKKKNL